MASPTLAITLTTSATCADITVTDATADYGVPTVPTSGITSCVIVVTLSGGSYLTFTFTIAANVITAATLGLSGATATSILSSLASTVFPFVATPFSIWRDYDVTVPEFADGVVDVTYTIAGTDSNGIAYTGYTTSAAVLVPCVSACCCVNAMALAIDPNCDCEDCIWNYLKADTYLNLAALNTQIGNTTRAALFLTKAETLCDCDCG